MFIYYIFAILILYNLIFFNVQPFYLQIKLLIVNLFLAVFASGKIYFVYIILTCF